MQMPGEALLLKMWETLIEKGIGGLIIPYYVVWKDRKFALNKIELDKQCRVATAKAEQEIAQITGSETKLIGYSEATSEENGSELSIKDTVLNSDIKRLIREEINVSSAINYANERLIEDDSNVPEEVVSQDWLNMWRDNASKVSDKDVQSLWGNVLAQEFLEPGRYSLRLLEFLRTMSKSDALLIEKIAPYTSKFGVIFGVSGSQKNLIDDSKFIESTSINRTDLRLLEELGFISDLTTLGMISEITNIASELKNSNEQYETKYMGCILIDENKILTISNENTENKLSIAYFPITKLGREILSLVNYEVEPCHLEWLANQLEKDYKVALCNYSNETVEPLHLFNS